MSNLIITGTTPGPCGCCGEVVCATWDPESAGIVNPPYTEYDCLITADTPATSVSASSDGVALTVGASKTDAGAPTVNEVVVGSMFLAAGSTLNVAGSVSGGTAGRNMTVTVYDEFGNFVDSGFQGSLTNPLTYSINISIPADGNYLIVLETGATNGVANGVTVVMTGVASSDMDAVVNCLIDSHGCDYCVCTGLP